MSENYYNEIFETIKSNLVPKSVYEESRLEIGHLKSELENAKEELKKMKSKYEEEKLKNDIIQAEKECLEAEKKTFELKFNELSLKLKLKSNQYDSLLSSGKTDCKSNDTEKISMGTQTVKEEPQDIGIVNTPTSTSEIGTKRTSTVSADDQRKKAKRKKTTRSDSTTRNTRKSTRNERKFTCEYCIDKWRVAIEFDFGGDPDKENVPDPRQIISTFSSFEALKDHCTFLHGLSRNHLCAEKSCLYWNGHLRNGKGALHGKNICKICDKSFELQRHLDQHMAYGHADLDMTKKQFYESLLKDEDSYYV